MTRSRWIIHRGHHYVHAFRDTPYLAFSRHWLPFWECLSHPTKDAANYVCVALDRGLAAGTFVWENIRESLKGQASEFAHARVDVVLCGFARIHPTLSH